MKAQAVRKEAAVVRPQKYEVHSKHMQAFEKNNFLDIIDTNPITAMIRTTANDNICQDLEPLITRMIESTSGFFPLIFSM